jgi:putative ABC transport system permease protein
MSLIETIRQDARHGARALVRTPGFTLAALLTLALGIGANSAIFTVVNAVLLRPLPYADPDTRVMIWSRWTAFDKTWVSEGEVVDYRRSCRTLADVATWDTGQANLTGDGEPLQVGVSYVTPNTFGVLGAQPVLGRVFSDRDAVKPPRYVMISHGLWQRRYGSDPAIVGRTIQINGAGAEVVGVMAEAFRLPTDFGEFAAAPSDLWMAYRLDEAGALADRGGHGSYAAARLKPGVTVAQVNSELATLTAGWSRTLPQYPPEMRFTAFAVSLRDEVVGGVRPAILLLTGAVMFLLLIACANVASLLLARAETRQREIAVRCALGAGHWRLLRQLLTESLLLAIVSGAVGLGLAYAGLRLLLAIDPNVIPRAETVGIDAKVLLFTALLAIVTTILFSLAPALRAVKLDLADALKEGGRHGTVGVRRQRARDLLVVGEMALGVVLVIGAVLMVRSLWALQRIDLGFEPERVLTLRLSPPTSAYREPQQSVQFYARLLERVRALPDVRGAGAIRSLPLASTIGDWGAEVEGYVETPGHSAKGDWQVLSEGASETIGERLVRGRFLTASDNSSLAPPVALINETMARLYWAGRDPIGGRFRVGHGQRSPWFTVVGIVANERHNGVDQQVKEKFYIPHAQWNALNMNVIRAMTLVVKSDGDPRALEAPIRAIVHELDPNLPVANIRLMTDVVGTALATPRFTGWLLALFAVLALVLSAVGIYGVLAYLVTQRTHEIGIRLAMGADRPQVLRMVLGHGLALAVIGLVLGVGAAFFLTSLMATQLHDVAPRDLTTFTGVPLLMVIVALGASYIPAWRATRVDPLVALRAD